MIIPTKYLIPLIIIAVAIGYYFVGEIALGGLLAGLFGIKGKKKKASDAQVRADVRDSNSDQRFDESIELHEEAVDSHNDAMKAAEDTTEPNAIPENAGFKRRNTRSS